MRKNLLALALLIVALTAGCTTPVMAKEKTAPEKNLGHFGAWHAYAQDEGGQTVCYMVTTKLIKPTVLKRGTPYLMITHRPVEASTDVFSYGAGAALDSKRGAKIRVGTMAFDLFSVRDIAWARDALTDHKIAATIKTATVAQATGFTATKKGIRQVSDLFDVTGSGDAYHAIGKACGLIHDKAKNTAKKHAVSATK